MFKVIKNEPHFFVEAKSKVKRPNESNAWSDENINSIREDLALYILNEQSGLCIYCEKVVKDYPKNCHIDHYKKRGYFPNETLNYDNLLISCNNENRCAKYKDKKIKQEDYLKFINPILENPEDFLEYTFYGELKPKDSLNQVDKDKAVFTIDILNLNERSLVEERKTVILQICAMISQIKNLEQIKAYGLNNFVTLLKWVFEHKVICS